MTGGRKPAKRVDTASAMDTGNHIGAGPGPAEALAGVADGVREQQSPGCACARERDGERFGAAGHPGKAGVTTQWRVSR